jgi:hypothetical protein
MDKAGSPVPDGKAGLPTEYGGIEETMSPAALAVIVDWTTQSARRVTASGR